MAKERVELTPELMEEICEAIATSTLGIRKLHKLNPHWPSVKHIFAMRIRDPKFGEQYARAKADQIEALVDEMLDIADDGSNDTYVNDEGKVCTDYDVLARSRLRIDLRKWYACKLAPKVYGDKLETTQNVTVTDKVIRMKKSKEVYEPKE